MRGPLIGSIHHQIGGVGNNQRLAVPDNLRHTLLFASALQVLGADHELTCHLEDVVRERDRKPANEKISHLPNDEREQLLARFEELMCQLPEEARAA